ncbi:malate synthase G [Ningiella sp. W23]|uniref:malate synthase G n=1 Tax=Ningiella sp. W23 TaxID=3023715 RepID=UPI003757C483
MTTYIDKGQLKIEQTLYEFVMQEALANSGVNATQFWQGFEKLLDSFTERNHALLHKRTQLQTAIDEFHIHNNDASFEEYKRFLESISYLRPSAAEPNSEKVQISTQHVDSEIANIAGPQLVVPINNARYALNAVNARWGSLYDALYGTDLISTKGELSNRGKYNQARGAAVIKRAREYLDQIAPLQSGSHSHSVHYGIIDNTLIVNLSDGSSSALANPAQFIGFNGSIDKPDSLLLSNNGLHIEIQLDEQHPIGRSDPANIKDILVEAALTTIMDCEDSVAAVDAEDKTQVYRNWLGLMQGTLKTEINKDSKTVIRKMHVDRVYKDAQQPSQNLTLAGRSLMFIRNVGHLMQNDAVLFNNEPIFEGIMDAVITSLIAKHDVLNNSPFKNSKRGSIYIVKPKMHGPEEVAFTHDLFTAVENLIDVNRFTIKIGIMDEERRTSLHLAECIAQAKERVVFINTGFLDRTGDEIHTSMLKGPFAPKAELKNRPWLQAYEMANVITGLHCGLSGKAQIGKGMWPIPDQMTNMMKAKIAHPRAGANTAWVPSPTAATLHALHYHQVDVFAIQEHLAKQTFDGINQILDIPLLETGRELSSEEIQQELDNNVQSILGYVVRWVHQGIGCSKVPDINNVGLMEDRATLRISSQHIANWLEHGLLSPQQVNESLTRMAELVDRQNHADPEYISMLPDLENSIGFQAAKDLIFLGKVQPNGYTEPLLHQRRKEMKARLANNAFSKAG